MIKEASPYIHFENGIGKYEGITFKQVSSNSIPERKKQDSCRH